SLVVGLSLLLVGHVCADIPPGPSPRQEHFRPQPPAPSEIKYSDARIRFEGIEKFPHQVFCVLYATSIPNPSGRTEIHNEIIEVKDSDAITLTNTNGNLQLLTIKRDEFTRQAKADPTLHWMNAGTKGVMVADAQLPGDEAPLVTT